MEEGLPGPVDFNIEAAWKRALEERPEILIADGTLKALQLDEVAKKSDYYPKVFARGSYDYMQNSYQVHEGNWSLILGMNVNLFNGGSTRADVMKSRSQQYQLLEQRAKLVDDIRLEVQKYLLDLENARERDQVTRDAMEQAKENLRMNRVRYEEGVGDGNGGSGCRELDDRGGDELLPGDLRFSSGRSWILLRHGERLTGGISLDEAGIE